MSDRVFLRLVVIFLGLSCLVFPATTSPDFDEPDLLLSSVHQGEVLDMSNGVELGGLEEDAVVEGRMDLETNDYGGTGANRDHEPKTPGRG